MLKIEEKKIKEIKENIENPRKHNSKQVEQIANSILEFGFTNPILVDKNLQIIAGHGRYLAAKKLRMSTVPVIALENLTEQQIKALTIADNKLGMNSVWDEDLLWKQIRELTDIKYDINLLGFDEEQIIPYIQDENLVNNILEEWQDMPAYDQEDLTAHRTMLVHFENDEDVLEFSKIVKQKFTEKTKYIWYPKQINMETESKRYD